jgi:hypothetical protein
MAGVIMRKEMRVRKDQSTNPLRAGRPHRHQAAVDFPVLNPVSNSRRYSAFLGATIVVLAAIVALSTCIAPAAFAFSSAPYGAYGDGSSNSSKIGSVSDYMNQGQPERMSYGPQPYMNPGGPAYGYGAPQDARKVAINRLIVAGLALGIMAIQQSHHHHHRHHHVRSTFASQR